MCPPTLNDELLQTSQCKIYEANMKYSQISNVEKIPNPSKRSNSKEVIKEEIPKNTESEQSESMLLLHNALHDSPFSSRIVRRRARGHYDNTKKPAKPSPSPRKPSCDSSRADHDKGEVAATHKSSTEEEDLKILKARLEGTYSEDDVTRPLFMISDDNIATPVTHVPLYGKFHGIYEREDDKIQPHTTRKDRNNGSIIWGQPECSSYLQKAGIVIPSDTVFPEKDIAIYSAGGMRMKNLMNSKLIAPSKAGRCTLTTYLVEEDITHVLFLAVNRIYPEKCQRNIECLNSLIPNCPPKLCFVIASREEPWQVKRYLKQLKWQTPVLHASKAVMIMMLGDLSAEPSASSVFLLSCRGQRTFFKNTSCLEDISDVLHSVVFNWYWRSVPCHRMFGAHCSAIGSRFDLHRMDYPNCTEKGDLQLQALKAVNRRDKTKPLTCELQFVFDGALCTDSFTAINSTYFGLRKPDIYMFVHMGNNISEPIGECLKYIEPIAHAMNMCVLLSANLKSWKVTTICEQLASWKFRNPFLLTNVRDLYMHFGHRSFTRPCVVLADGQLNVYYRDLLPRELHGLPQAIHYWGSHCLGIAPPCWPSLDSYAKHAEYMWCYLRNTSSHHAVRVLKEHRLAVRNFMDHVKMSKVPILGSGPHGSDETTFPALFTSIDTKVLLSNLHTTRMLPSEPPIKRARRHLSVLEKVWCYHREESRGARQAADAVNAWPGPMEYLKAQQAAAAAVHVGYSESEDDEEERGVSNGDEPKVLNDEDFEKCRIRNAGKLLRVKTREKAQNDFMESFAHCINQAFEQMTKAGVAPAVQPKLVPTQQAQPSIKLNLEEETSRLKSQITKEDKDENRKFNNDYWTVAKEELQPKSATVPVSDSEVKVDPAHVRAVEEKRMQQVKKTNALAPIGIEVVKLPASGPKVNDRLLSPTHADARARVGSHGGVILYFSDVLHKKGFQLRGLENQSIRGNEFKLSLGGMGVPPCGSTGPIVYRAGRSGGQMYLFESAFANFIISLREDMKLPDKPDVPFARLRLDLKPITFKMTSNPTRTEILVSFNRKGLPFRDQRHLLLSDVVTVPFRGLELDSATGNDVPAEVETGSAPATEQVEEPVPSAKPREASPRPRRVRTRAQAKAEAGAESGKEIPIEHRKVPREGAILPKRCATSPETVAAVNSNGKHACGPVNSQIGVSTNCSVTPDLVATDSSLAEQRANCTNLPSAERPNDCQQAANGVKSLSVTNQIVKKDETTLVVETALRAAPKGGARDGSSKPVRTDAEESSGLAKTELVTTKRGGRKGTRNSLAEGKSEIKGTLGTRKRAHRSISQKITGVGEQKESSPTIVKANSKSQSTESNRITRAKKAINNCTAPSEGVQVFRRNPEGPGSSRKARRVEQSVKKQPDLSPIEGVGATVHDSRSAIETVTGKDKSESKQPRKRSGTNSAKVRRPRVAKAAREPSARQAGELSATRSESTKAARSRRNNPPKEMAEEQKLMTRLRSKRYKSGGGAFRETAAKKARMSEDVLCQRGRAVAKEPRLLRVEVLDKSLKGTTVPKDLGQSGQVTRVPTAESLGRPVESSESVTLQSTSSSGAHSPIQHGEGAKEGFWAQAKMSLAAPRKGVEGSSGYVTPTGGGSEQTSGKESDTPASERWVMRRVWAERIGATRTVKPRASKTKAQAIAAALAAETFASDSADSDDILQGVEPEPSISSEDLEKVIESLEGGSLSCHPVVNTAVAALRMGPFLTDICGERTTELDDNGSAVLVDRLVDKLMKTRSQKRIRSGAAVEGEEPRTKRCRPNGREKGKVIPREAETDGLPEISDMDPILSSGSLETEALEILRTTSTDRVGRRAQEAIAEMDREITARLRGNLVLTRKDERMVLVEGKIEGPVPPKRRGRKGIRASVESSGRSGSRPQRQRKPTLAVVESAMEAMEQAEKKAAKRAEQEAKRAEAEARKAEAEAKRAEADAKRAEAEAKKAARKADIEERRKLRAEAKAAAKAAAIAKRITRKPRAKIEVEALIVTPIPAEHVRETETLDVGSRTPRIGGGTPILSGEMGPLMMAAEEKPDCDATEADYSIEKLSPPMASPPVINRPVGHPISCDSIAVCSTLLTPVQALGRPGRLSRNGKGRAKLIPQSTLDTETRGPGRIGGRGRKPKKIVE